ncbi:MAG: glutamate 5-kinase [Coriobacteriales bacterium]|jgi:glutamate 5-kinase|nr:glutamate 5-kinase [Coriobacteriales bacterium]
MSDHKRSDLAHRIVIKIGSSTLTNEDGTIAKSYIADLAAQVRELHAMGSEVLIVTSAAITAGLQALGLPPQRPDRIPTLQAAAAVGQIELARAYARSFEAQGLIVGQILLTRFDTVNRESYLHARDTVERLLELGVVPLINENDTVAVDEIRFGDNDTLAAQVAILVKAELVVLLSDIEGLYTADPRLDEDAQLLESIAGFTEELVNAAGDAGTARGSGGMVTKLEAARMLMAAGIPMVICEGHRPHAVLDAACGKQVGTRFSSEKHSKQAGAKKLWIALSGTVKGSVFIDEGAVLALRERGSSLLPVGVVRVEGDFAAGQAVDIRTTSGFLVGRGLSNYSRDELALAVGHTSEQLAGNKLLIHLANKEVIHRDRLVVF